MPDFIPSILMILFWIFIISAISRGVRKVFGSQQNQQKRGPQPQNKSPQTFQEVFKELKKQMEEKQHIPPYAKQEEKRRQYPDLKTIVSEAKKLNQPVEKQKKYEHKEMIPLSEKQKANAYAKQVEAERRKQHDSEMHELEKKIYSTDIKDETVAYDFDLRNAVIGSMILERKFE